MGARPKVGSSTIGNRPSLKTEYVAAVIFRLTGGSVEDRAAEEAQIALERVVDRKLSRHGMLDTTTIVDQAGEPASVRVRLWCSRSVELPDT